MQPFRSSVNMHANTSGKATFVVAAFSIIAIAAVIMFLPPKKGSTDEPKTAFVSGGTVMKGKVVHQEYGRGNQNLIVIQRANARYSCLDALGVEPLVDQEVYFLKRAVNFLSTDGGLTPVSGQPTEICWVVKKSDLDYLRKDKDIKFVDQ